MAKTSRVGPRAPKRAKIVSVEYARQIIRDLKRHAQEGNVWAADSVQKWLEKFPELKTAMPEAQALAVKAEAAWVKAVAFGCPLAERAARDEVREMKAELLGDIPLVMERVLASTVIVAQLSYARAAVVTAQATDHAAVRAARERVLSAAQKRLQDAIKNWELISGKKARGVTAKGNIKIFEAGGTAA